jgi:hypothetical protein
MLENLEKIKNAKVITSPFPHLVIDNFLREETVQNLHNELRDNLSKEKINKAGIFTKELEKNSVKQFGAFDLNHEFLKNNESLKLSSRVNEFFGSFEFTDSLIKKLSGFLENSSGLEKKYFEKNRNNFNNDSRLAFVPPSDATKRREIHLDAPNTIIVFLYYIRLPEDYSFGGSLNLLSKEERYLFKSKLQTFFSDMLNVYPSDLNIEKTYDYLDNRLVVMCASGYSWHEVSTRRYATTPRINFHGGLRINQNTELTKYGKNPNLSSPLKSKVKYLINLFK